MTTTAILTGRRRATFLSRTVQPVGSGEIVALPQVGGLHHRYERLAA